MKKTIRRIILLTMILAVFGTSLNASAAVRPSVQPYYENAYFCSAALQISEKGLATCYGRIDLYSGVSADMTMTLYRSSNKTSWSSVKSWSTDETSIEKDYYITSGYYYRVMLDINIYNSQNKLSEEITEYSSVCSY